MMTKEEYVEKKQRQLDAWSAELDALESNAHRLGEVAAAKFRDNLVKLRDKRAEGLKRIEAIKAVSDGTWERFKADTETIWDAFSDSVRQFKSHFGTRRDPAAKTKA